jgi:hypothetical protein
MKKHFGVYKSNYDVGSELHLDPETGELITTTISRVPEFARMTTQPGLGKPFYDKYSDQLFNGRTTVRTKKGIRERRLPDYYFKLMDKYHPEMGEELKLLRKQRLADYQRNYPLESTPARMEVKAIVRDFNTTSIKAKRI